jgi:hypothetical protein
MEYVGASPRANKHAKEAVVAPLRRHRSDWCGGPVRPVAGEIPAVNPRMSPGQDPVGAAHVGLF